MTDKHYINEIGTEIVVDCGQDITAATQYVMSVRKPDGSFATWAASVYNNNFLIYDTVVGDFNVSGLYAIQPVITMEGWQGRGETVFFQVYGYFDYD